MRHIALLTTGGTIEKVYDEAAGALVNKGSIVERMVRRLRLEDTRITIGEVMCKDSLLITDDERLLIVKAVRDAMASSPAPTGIVVLHGTDTLCVTGDLLHEVLAPPSEPPGVSGSTLACPVVLTGAMRPFEMKQSDALQNLTEAIFATSLLPPGVYVAAHGRSLRFPGVVKDRVRGAFVRG
ncbi:MAG TPA: asparaginase [Phycisphaerales bacterium]|nr:asparaginase [Phycisphaerales bacterium]